MNLIARQDGTKSRTKQLNLVTLGLAIVGAVLPVFQVYVAPELYSAVLGIVAIVNQHFRNSQSAL